MATINKVSIQCNNGTDRVELELPYSVEIQSSDDTGILIQFIADLMKKVKELEIRLAALELSASIDHKTLYCCGTGPCSKEEEEEAIKTLKRIKEDNKLY